MTYIPPKAYIDPEIIYSELCEGETFTDMVQCTAENGSAATGYATTV